MKKPPQRTIQALEELLEGFPRGIALLELPDFADASTWQLAEINALAASLVIPSIDTFVSGERLGVGNRIDLPTVYREVLVKRQSRTLGMVEVCFRNVHARRIDARGVPVGARGLYTVSAFPVGESCVGILFEDAHSLVSARVARAEGDRQLTETCKFLGAILWRAEPHTLNFTFVSPQAQTILGYWPERWTGETNFWRKHLFPEDRERVVEECDKIVRERKRRDFEFRMTSTRGEILWFHAAAELVAKGSGRGELSGVMNDITELKRAEERIRGLSSRLMRLQDDERRHISRELHDSLGQYLTSMKINFDILKREGAGLGEAHRILLAESAETLERCIKEVRSVSYLLHPPLLDELGLLAALRWYAAGFAERSSIVVHLDASSEFGRLPKEMEMAAFRIVQESLTNVQRHSHSDAVWVALAKRKDRAEVRITDQGVGVPTKVIESIQQGRAIEGVGLRGMYERVRELGGNLEIESSERGTAVAVLLPFRRREGKGQGGSSDVRIEGHASGSDPDGRARARKYRAKAERRGRASRR